MDTAYILWLNIYFVGIYFLCLYPCAEGGVEKEACNQKVWCADCITARHGCSWCKDVDYAESRCSPVEDLVEKKCQEIFNRSNSITVTESEGLRDGTETIDPVQVQPQRMKVSLRIGQPYPVDISFRIARNLPIDMYFVLDYSLTMEPRLQNLANLAQTLINDLKRDFTENIYIGYGSFLDKRAQPFYVTTKHYMENPCVITNQHCVPSYGFIHRQRLNKDVDAFISSIRLQNTSANYDPMEGGLDALLQAAVCPDIIGWRTSSRRVVVYMSDSGFHFAGDGKLAGIDKPNDGRCHLERTGNEGHYNYTEELSQDYPSFGQLREALDENKINTFFIVDSTHRAMYKGLSFMLKQAETSTMDSKGAQDVVESITSFYTRLSKKVELSAKHIPEYIDVKMSSNCAETTGVTNTQDLKMGPFKCPESGIDVGSIVNFKMELLANACPANISESHTFTIIPAGLQEDLEVQVSYVCSCECLRNEELDMSKCSNGNGTYECGVCRCKEGRSGEFCQCSNDEDASPSVAQQRIDESNCKKDNASDVICENKGLCRCGQCDCHKSGRFKRTGKFCECDPMACMMPGADDLCGGKGDCGCSTCKCKDEYYGEFCQCPPSSNCMAENGLVCGGHGECDCGVCVCHRYYTGDVCESCPRCDKCRRCGYAACVKCHERHQTGDNTTYTDCHADCHDVNVTRVDRFKQDVEPCGFIDAADCEINYVVLCDDKAVYLLIAKTKQCSNPPDPLLIAMPLLGGIIGVGLLLLIIWKILTSFYDKIEYARFEHEVKDPKWAKGDNPIYQTPVTSNLNPVYQGNVD